jgi:BNR repeat-like domain
MKEPFTIHYRHISWLSVLFLTALALIMQRSKPLLPLPTLLPVSNEVIAAGPILALDNGRWIRSFRAADGTIYLKGRLKTRDGGLTVEAQDRIDVEALNAAPERAVFARPGLFYALDGPVEMVVPGVYRVQGWRSIDELRTLTTETVRIEVPEGPRRGRSKGEWYGLYVYRTILEMPDKSWLLTMYGNFYTDTLQPPDRFSQSEVKYMMRSFVLTSHDQGRSWRYLSTIAAPMEGEPIGEGFVEPAITKLADGRLLCILRTGHHYPLYACYSSDNGKSWTDPVYTGLDRGCDPCLVTLADGRLVLSWGRRFPEKWSRIDRLGDAARFSYPGNGFVNLALSGDGGATWTNTKIAQATGSCYSTILEVAPNVILFQVDSWIWRVALRP